MRQRSRVLITDCEGPISRNDNAFELTNLFVPSGDRFFTLISRYDDVLADIVKKPGYKAGDTLRLILPFLRACGATNSKMRAHSARNILLVPGADETLRFISGIMPSFIVSTSYEHYISALCEAIGFPQENAYCTRLNIDKYVIGEQELKRLRSLKEEISRMPMIEIPSDARAPKDLPQETKATVKRLDEIFWREILTMESGKMLKEVSPVGGFEKANAVRKIVGKLGADLEDVIYVGDSITDADPFRLVRKGGGLTVSFNGNRYAIREAEIAVMSHHTVVIAILAEVFQRFGREHVVLLAENWLLSSLERQCTPLLLESVNALPTEEAPRIARISEDNMEHLIRESSAFRKTVRGEAIGKLG
jgi:energy-converting hydrogenase A subunit R